MRKHILRSPTIPENFFITYRFCFLRQLIATQCDSKPPFFDSIIYQLYIYIQQYVVSESIWIIIINNICSSVGMRHQHMYITSSHIHYHGGCSDICSVCICLGEIIRQTHSHAGDKPIARMCVLPTNCCCCCRNFVIIENEFAYALRKCVRFLHELFV